MIYIDFDGVIASTIETICDLYNYDFQYYSNYKRINWWDVDTWEFIELNCTTPEYIDQYFNQPRFFDNLKLIPNAEFAIQILLSKYDVCIVSMGNPANLLLKEKYIRSHPILRRCKFIGCMFKNHKDKSHIDMSNDIFIDDLASNLETSNAKTKICFGDDYSWNKDYTGARCYNWYDVLRYLKLIT